MIIQDVKVVYVLINNKLYGANICFLFCIRSKAGIKNNELLKV